MAKKLTLYTFRADMCNNILCKNQNKNWHYPITKFCHKCHHSNAIKMEKQILTTYVLKQIIGKSTKKYSPPSKKEEKKSSTTKKLITNAPKRSLFIFRYIAKSRVSVRNIIPLLKRRVGKGRQNSLSKSFISK